MTRTRAVELGLGTAFIGTLVSGAAVLLFLAVAGSDWTGSKRADFLLAGLSVAALAAAPLAIAAAKEG